MAAYTTRISWLYPWRLGLLFTELAIGPLYTPSILWETEMNVRCDL